MCGITGIIDFKNQEAQPILDKMVEVLQHRGPNDRGTEVFKSDAAWIGLGQSRLSILDLSKAGHQPMQHQNLTITFNGEIYNFKEIRNDLIKLGHKFETNTDTEVILRSFDEWQTSCVTRFIGMFAFVIYDSTTKVLYGFRDRAGVKPFYYYKTKNLFLFGSELKSFHQHPQFKKSIDQRALQTYFNYGYVPAPYSIFENTYKLEPGHFFTYNLTENSFATQQYWNVLNYYTKPKLQINYNEAKNELHDLLVSAFTYRMVSDVPVGIFLSGGYDSSAVAAILQSNSTTKLNTFTIGFEEGNNEAPYARQTAAYLATEHHELICTTKEAQEIIPDLPLYYDEPFADSSAIPTMLVSKFAREKVTVALSVDGGDEVFAGYNSYLSLQNKLNHLNRIPAVLKSATGSALAAIESLIPSATPVIKHKVYGLSKSLNRDRDKQATDLFRIMNSLPLTYSQNLFNANIKPYQTNYTIASAGFSNELEMAMAVDYTMYLPNDILTKVDRATMAFSLEGREPLLDHRIIEFAAQLPLDYKYEGATSKRILKDIVHTYLPKEMMDRPKTGFSLPIHAWLKGDLAYLLEEYLSEEALSESELFNVPFVVKQVDLFKKGKLHYLTLIWKLLMFQMWYKKWL